MPRSFTRKTLAFLVIIPWASTTVHAANATVLPLRLNAGGPAFTDTVTGYEWENDMAYLPDNNGGTSTTWRNITNSSIDSRVYQSVSATIVWC